MEQQLIKFNNLATETQVLGEQIVSLSLFILLQDFKLLIAQRSCRKLAN